MTHLEKIQRWLRGRGTEIGAFNHPLPGIQPIYVDCFDEYAGQKCLLDYRGDATRLPFRDSTLDYVAASHIIEHVANPIRALLEWHRVLRHGGVIYLVAPDRRFTFDHTRPLTPVDHLWQDFAGGVTQSDGTHIDEYVDQVDWSIYAPQLTGAALSEHREWFRRGMRHAVSTGEDINIHFHTFEPGNLRQLLEEIPARRELGCQWTIVDEAERFPADCPNGILFVLRVSKNSAERLRAVAQWTLERARLRSFLKPGASRDTFARD